MTRQNWPFQASASKSDKEARDAADAIAAAECDRARMESARADTITIDGVTVRKSVAKASERLLDALKDARYKLYGNEPGYPGIDSAIAEAEGSTKESI